METVLAKPFSSYPSIYALGHRAVTQILEGSVVVQEKVDGSQFSFGVSGGVLKVRSKKMDVDIEHPVGMFQEGVATVLRIKDQLQDGWIYRGEYLRSPHHNVLAYGRIPKGHVILFDVLIGMETYLPPEGLASEAERLGLESVPLFHNGTIENVEQFKPFLERESVLGGTIVEGIVIKNYDQFTPDKKIAIGKIVRDGFKEKANQTWKEQKPPFFSSLVGEYRTEARWQKAVQHLEEQGLLSHEPKDIGPLVREVQSDVILEYGDEIKERIFAHFRKEIEKGVVVGLPEWYKARLADPNGLN